jgi:hypothetical protein
MQTELIRRDSIAELLVHRDAAVELYRRAAELILEANKAARRAAPSSRTCELGYDEMQRLAYISEQRAVEEFADAARRRTDCAVWRHLLGASGLGALMDRTARERFESQIEKDTPECTLDTVCATMFTQAADAGNIFERGVVEAFGKLRRHYKTNDPFKIGLKIIMGGALLRGGYWNHYCRADDDLFDIERAVMIVDGQQPVERHGGIVGKIGEAMRDKCDEAETAYFSVKIFRNGNLHVTFKRADLIECINRIIARHGGAAVPDATEARRKRRR